MKESGVPQVRRFTVKRYTGRPARAAAGGAAAALYLLAGLAVFVGGGCASTAPTAPPATARLIESEVSAGMRLYQGGDFALAASRLRAAADEAGRCGEPVTEANIRVGECTAWLRGSKVEEFRRCTARLEVLQGELGYSEPGVNTLLALGAIARGEALPPFRLPRAVRQLLQTTAAGGA